MRKLAFGYSTKCNIRCEYCVATEDLPADKKMDSDRAREIIVEMAQAGVGGISFSAGEPFLYFNEIVALVKLCQRIGIYTRMVTNSFWAKTAASSDRRVSELKKNGLCQLRLSFSRWHQKHVNKDNVLNAGRAVSFKRRQILTDYQASCCDMNPCLTPDLDMYACCDAGSHFPETDFFYLGNLKDNTIKQLFAKTETDRLHNLIRTMGIAHIASYTGMRAREIITYSKCELCRKLFNSPETVTRLKAEIPQLTAWCR
ncbi:MAG: hypothetical protein SRB2_00145 [Desulfobacteraceae bacterium Eth-SRB2]|nr:MAG: hypothetical protein SRB2_00145 [Desulfobacteraceae bacterium Eth-SRB2]